MSFALNAGSWWQCSGDKLWALNLRRSSLVAQCDVIAAVGTKLKGYLRYKTITTQNVSYKARVKDFFIS